MMGNRIVCVLAAAGMVMSALGFSKAFDRVGDRWSFDLPPGADPMEARFTTPYNPQRVAELHPGVIVGVPGVEGQAFWCAPGTSIRLPSAMILPQKGDFTFCFYAGFPLPFTGGQMLAYNPKMSVFLTPEGKFGTTLARTTLSGGASVADGRWHHLAVVRRGDVLSLWVDGAQVAAKASVKDTVYDHIVGVVAQWMLLSTNNANRTFLDEVTAFRAALEPDDLRQLASRAAAAKAPCVTPAQEQQHAAVLSMVKDGAHVIDIGCGDGTLLNVLKKNRHVTGDGVEIDITEFEEAVADGNTLLWEDADEGITLVPDGYYDLAICSETLQVVKNPRGLLHEALRLADEAIVSFPNFAAYRIRLTLGLGGHLPVSKQLPFQWYDTPNIHLITLKDFRNLCEKEGIEILELKAESRHPVGKLLLALGFKNLGASRIIARIARKRDSHENVNED